MYFMRKFCQAMPSHAIREDASEKPRMINSTFKQGCHTRTYFLTAPSSDLPKFPLPFLNPAKEKIVFIDLSIVRQLFACILSSKQSHVLRRADSHNNCAEGRHRLFSGQRPDHIQHTSMSSGPRYNTEYPGSLWWGSAARGREWSANNNE